MAEGKNEVRHVMLLEGRRIRKKDVMEKGGKGLDRR